MIEIVLSSYNGSRWIDQQIESIASQTFCDWLLTVRDDGSSDDTVARVNAWKERLDERMRILPSDGNVGVVRSFEILLEQSVGDYVMMCDQDDVWLPRKVETTYERMQMLESSNPGMAAMVFTAIELVDGDLNDMGCTFFQQNRFDFPFATHYNNICVCNCVAGCTMMLNRRAVKAVLPFGAHAPYHDWWIAARITKLGVTSVVEEPLMLYRLHGENACGAKKSEKGHYAGILINPLASYREFAKLRPFLRELEFGGMCKFYFYKLRHFVHRKWFYKAY